jgi:hypothetical protein
MTDAEWSNCSEPDTPLLLLRGKLSDRKLRLFSCACCRRLWHLLDSQAQDLVDVYERHLDGLVTPSVLAIAKARHQESVGRMNASYIAANTVTAATAGAAWAAAWNVVGEARRALRHCSRRPDSHEPREQVTLFREIFGNPFRPVTFDPAIREWNGGTAVALARMMHERQDFNQAPLLADMLEDAGATAVQLLDHLRGAGEHVRGCFAVDLVMGKE